MGQWALCLLKMCAEDMQDGVRETSAAYSDFCRSLLMHLNEEG